MAAECTTSELDASSSVQNPQDFRHIFSRVFFESLLRESTRFPAYFPTQKPSPAHEAHSTVSSLHTALGGVVAAMLWEIRTDEDLSAASVMAASEDLSGIAAKIGASAAASDDFCGWALVR